MPISSQPPPMNPTVEEMQDKSEPSSAGGNVNAAAQQLSWAEVCAQHEFLLESHLKLLRQVQGEVPSNGDASRLVSNMLERTKKLVMQFKVIKGRFGPKASVAGRGSQPASSSDPTTSRSTSDSSGNGSRPRVRMKRARADESELDSEGITAVPAAVDQSVLSDHTRFQKRKRLMKVLPGDEDVRNVNPISIDTEDISEEVQRRLAIREEYRRKRGSTKAEKRKRDSLTSTGSAPSPRTGAVTSQPRKKIRTGATRDH
ncbi:uncharacterized protein BO97DRAFT_476284 [Aspergillus homomorphus CBS 101889]|uniref:Uncharacterized protein n=1 Tax=Aspergillus homomorphus (strain CBS 101889) TaxID=1450537 RepID=A0A395I533_ASPHC|nr:hypothetical protein BO97DRAFT_476284 [Aspergillus homomorphus CBS 101889]RAL14866.1 hypothetical protein BO97DRAFT_476284 [Aspergillus homomorphus CBS 101889]